MILSSGLKEVLKRKILLRPDKMRRLVEATSGKKTPARIIPEKQVADCFRLDFEVGRSVGPDPCKLKELISVDSWESIGVRRYPFKLENGRLFLSPQAHSAFNLCDELFGMSLLGVSYLAPQFLFKGTAEFATVVIYYPKNVLNWKAFTEVPHHDSYESTCLFNVSRGVQSRTLLYIDFKGKYLVPFMVRKDNEGLVFPQKMKYSISELGIDLDHIHEMYVKKERGGIELMKRSTNQINFEKAVDEIKADGGTYSILHKGKGDRPRMNISICKELSQNSPIGG